MCHTTKEWECQFLKDLKESKELDAQEKLDLIQIEINRMLKECKEQNEILQEATQNGETLPCFGESILETMNTNLVCIQLITDFKKELERQLTWEEIEQKH